MSLQAKKKKKIKTQKVFNKILEPTVENIVKSVISTRVTQKYKHIFIHCLGTAKQKEFCIPATFNSVI